MKIKRKQKFIYSSSLSLFRKNLKFFSIQQKVFQEIAQHMHNKINTRKTIYSWHANFTYPVVTFPFHVLSIRIDIENRKQVQCKVASYNIKHDNVKIGFQRLEPVFMFYFIKFLNMLARKLQPLPFRKAERILDLFEGRPKAVLQYIVCLVISNMIVKLTCHFLLLNFFFVVK